MKFGAVKKTLYVTGQRVRERRGLSRIEPAESVPVRYENAFGGTGVDENGEPTEWAENPIGKGFEAHRTDDGPVPQVYANSTEAEQIAWQRVVQTAGLGPIAPHWSPRRDRAGTYNEMWKQTRFPDLPEDFDFSFYNAAPAGLMLDGFAKETKSLSYGT